MSTTENIVMGKVNSQDGKATLRITKDFVANSASDVLELMIKEGSLSQRALAQKVSEDMEAAGFNFTDSDSHFSQMVNNPDHNLYKYLEMIVSICKHQNLSWMAEYLAVVCGGKFIREKDGD